MSTPLYRLVYRSESFLGSEEARRAELDAILARSRVRNAASGLTGVLTLSDAVFVQVLEGPMPALEATFERICCDLRHSAVAVLELTVADRRLFDGWAMAEIRPEDQTRALVGLIAAPHGGSQPSIEQTEAAVRLMSAMVAVSGGAPGVALAAA